jgi:rRNA pseudouridine-1189 N-methylase Emg1 (Nep1/Mra1 family)
MVKLLVGGEKLLSNKVLLEVYFQTENKTVIQEFV